jgi:hypothetical protein
MGLNEAAGYLAVAVTAYLTGLIAARAGLRPEPFYLGRAYAGLGLGLSVLLVRETRGHARLEAQLADPDRPAGQNGAAARHPAAARPDQLSTVQVVAATSWREPSLSMTAPTTTSAPCWRPFRPPAGPASPRRRPPADGLTLS